MAAEIKTGTYEGTAAAINISLGWVPDYVKVWNAEDGDVAWEWFNGMGAGDALSSANHDTAQHSLITANGIDAYEPDTPNAQGYLTATPGFTVGTALSESGKTFRYVAMRSGDY
jgi:hypothetical protein